MDGAVSLQIRTRMGWGIARRPEWWVYALAIGAGLVLMYIAIADQRGMSAPHLGASHEHASIASHTRDAAQADWSIHTWLTWMLMVVAMMLPIIAPVARRVAMRSLWRRRHRAIIGFIGGYLIVWAAGGAAMIGVAAASGVPHGSPDLIAAGLLGAAAWQVAAWRRQVMRRCGSLRPSAVRGWIADRDAIVAGSRVGLRCAFTCWPVMLVMALSHGLLLMGGITALLMSERARGPNPERRSGRAMESWCLVALAVTVSMTAASLRWVQGSTTADALSAAGQAVL